MIIIVAIITLMIIDFDYFIIFILFYLFIIYFYLFIISSASLFLNFVVRIFLLKLFVYLIKSFSHRPLPWHASNALLLRRFMRNPSAFRLFACRLYDTKNVLVIRSQEERVGAIGVVVDRQLIVRCKIGWFLFHRSTLTQDRSSLRDAIYGRIRLPNAHSLHWSITKAAFGPILLGGLLEQ